MVNRLKIGTKIGASFALGIALFTGISLLAYRGINQLIETSRLETHTYQVLAALEEISAQVINAETGQRGYIITGATEYLEPYTSARSNVTRKLQELQELTRDNPNQQQRLSRLVPQVQARFEVMQAVIDTRRTSGLTAAQRQIQTDRGKQLMDALRQTIAEMRAEEQILLAERQQGTAQATKQTLNSLAFGIPLYLGLLGLIGLALSRHISRPLRQISEASEQLGAGNLTVRSPVTGRSDEIGILSTTFNQMVDNLQTTKRKDDDQNWLKSNLADAAQLVQGQRNQEQLARQILSYVAPRVNAQQGVFYLLDVEPSPPLLKLLSSYAYQERRHLGNQFHLGEGLVGQCALEQQRILLTEVPSDYVRIGSGLGETTPATIVVLPVLFEQQTIGVLELSSLHRFSEIEMQFLEGLCATLGVVLNAIAADRRTAQLLEEAQALTEELQQQQDDLHLSNRRLEQQAVALQASEAQLKEQQEELQQTNEELQQLNEELEEKAELLAVQKQDVETKNQTIEQARQALEEKAAQLSLSSRYKSGFVK